MEDNIIPEIGEIEAANNTGASVSADTEQDYVTVDGNRRLYVTPYYATGEVNIHQPVDFQLRTYDGILDTYDNLSFDITTKSTITQDGNPSVKTSATLKVTNFKPDSRVSYVLFEVFDGDPDNGTKVASVSFDPSHFDEKHDYIIWDRAVDVWGHDVVYERHVRDGAVPISYVWNQQDGYYYVYDESDYEWRLEDCKYIYNHQEWRAGYYGDSEVIPSRYGYGVYNNTTKRTWVDDRESGYLQDYSASKNYVYDREVDENLYKSIINNTPYRILKHKTYTVKSTTYVEGFARLRENCSSLQIIDVYYTDCCREYGIPTASIRVIESNSFKVRARVTTDYPFVANYSQFAKIAGSLSLFEVGSGGTVNQIASAAVVTPPGCEYADAEFSSLQLTDGNTYYVGSGGTTYTNQNGVIRPTNISSISSALHLRNTSVPIVSPGEPFIGLVSCVAENTPVSVIRLIADADGQTFSGDIHIDQPGIYKYEIFAIGSDNNEWTRDGQTFNIASADNNVLALSSDGATQTYSMIERPSPATDNPSFYVHALSGGQSTVTVTPTAYNSNDIAWNFTFHVHVPCEVSFDKDFVKLIVPCFEMKSIPLSSLVSNAGKTTYVIQEVCFQYGSDILTVVSGTGVFSALASGSYLFHLPIQIRIANDRKSIDIIADTSRGLSFNQIDLLCKVGEDYANKTYRVDSRYIYAACSPIPEIQRLPENISSSLVFDTITLMQGNILNIAQMWNRFYMDQEGFTKIVYLPKSVSIDDGYMMSFFDLITQIQNLEENISAINTVLLSYINNKTVLSDSDIELKGYVESLMEYNSDSLFSIDSHNNEDPSTSHIYHILKNRFEWCTNVLGCLGFNAGQDNSLLLWIDSSDLEKDERDRYYILDRQKSNYVNVSISGADSLSFSDKAYMFAVGNDPHMSIILQRSSPLTDDILSVGERSDYPGVRTVEVVLGGDLSQVTMLNGYGYDTDTGGFAVSNDTSLPSEYLELFKDEGVNLHVIATIHEAIRNMKITDTINCDTLVGNWTKYLTVENEYNDLSDTVKVSFYKTSLIDDSNSYTGAPYLVTREGDVINLPVPSRSGYSFAGWNTHENGIGRSYYEEYFVDAARLLYAQWVEYGQEAPMVTCEVENVVTDILLNPDDSQESPVTVLNVKLGIEDISGRGIAGYYCGDNVSVEQNDFTTVGGRESVISVIEIKTGGTLYITARGVNGVFSDTISIKAYGINLWVGNDVSDVSVDTRRIVVKDGEQFELPEPTRSGHEFICWVQNKNADNQKIYYANTPYTADSATFNNTTVYLSAQWDSVPVSSETGIVAVINSTNDVASEQTATLTFNDSAGISGYYWGTSEPNMDTEYALDNDVQKVVSSAGRYYLSVKNINNNIKTVYIDYCTTTLKANYDDVADETVLTQKGQSFKLPTPTRDGYDFVGWYKGDRNTDPFTETYLVNGDSTLVAKWKKTGTLLPTVTISSEDGASDTLNITMTISGSGSGIKRYFYGDNANYRELPVTDVSGNINERIYINGVLVCDQTIQTSNNPRTKYYIPNTGNKGYLLSMYANGASSTTPFGSLRLYSKPFEQEDVDAGLRYAKNNGRITDEDVQAVIDIKNSIDAQSGGEI